MIFPVEANVLSSQYNGSGVFNVGAGQAMSFNEIVKTLNTELGLKLEPDYINCSFSEKYQSHTLADLNKININIGYTPKYLISKLLQD